MPTLVLHGRLSSVIESMQFSDEELIAYLLGDAPAEVVQLIEQGLDQDKDLKRRIEKFRKCLGIVRSLADEDADRVFEPPAGLLDATMARIDQAGRASVFDANDLDAPPAAKNVENPPPSIELSERCESRLRCRRRTLTSAPGLSSENSFKRQSFWDSSALTICLTVLCCISLPALVRMRFESRRAQCAHNLRNTGMELINYALIDPSGRFPFVSVDGPESFAGVYAVYLKDVGAPISPSQLHCASLLGYEPSGASTDAGGIPTFAELHRMAWTELGHWQRAIGGDFAYNLGVEEQGVPRAPKCEGRSDFAILADAPAIYEVGNPVPSSNKSPLPSPPTVRAEQFVAHDGRGINIFYEDGRVVFVSSNSYCFQPPGSDAPVGDNPFRNQLGAREIGLHARDASLAPSHFSPLGK